MNSASALVTVILLLDVSLMDSHRLIEENSRRFWNPSQLQCSDPKTDFLKTPFIIILPIFSYFFSFRCFHAVLSPFSFLFISAVQILRSIFWLFAIVNYAWWLIEIDFRKKLKGKKERFEFPRVTGRSPLLVTEVGWEDEAPPETGDLLWMPWNDMSPNERFLPLNEASLKRYVPDWCFPALDCI